jgi:diadenosine tetraphosphate (Ap4A) HIT family hydrolase
MILPKRNMQYIDQMTGEEASDFMLAIQVLCEKYEGIFEVSGKNNVVDPDYL